jgi:hypothetical protein
VQDDTEEIAVRVVDGRTELVLIDHEGREDVVPVRMLERQVVRPAA